jgi:tRNA pseudouridine55 synthase
MNRLIVADKPANISSNHFLSRLKRKYNEKKAGFSGTLDPFANGVLIVGFGSHTRLFRFLDKTPKHYRATLWLGADSKSLDIEMVQTVETLQPLKEQKIQETLKAMQTTLTYTPPIFSAKKINGKRAYELARNEETPQLKSITSTIYKTKLLHYCHPFVTFEVLVSEGTYVRSLGALLAQKLGISHGALTSLTRLAEGKFVYDDEKPLDIKKSLTIPQNYYTNDQKNILLGKPLELKDFTIRQEGYYWLDNNDTITIINICNGHIKYELNKVAIC